MGLDVVEVNLILNPTDNLPGMSSSSVAKTFQDGRTDH